MTFQQLNYFVCAASCGSFSKAASVCYVAQTAISKQIANLEDELNVRLFIRGNKSVRLTEAGAVLLGYARKLLDLHNEAVGETTKAEQATADNPVISVGYWGPIDPNGVSVLITRFLATVPLCSVNFLHVDLAEITTLLLNNSVDIVITPRSHIQDNPYVRATVLSTHKLGIAMSRQNSLSEKAVIRPEDLTCEKFVERSVDGSPGILQTYESYWEHLGFKPDRIIKTPEYRSLFMTVASNMGVAFLPNYFEELNYNNIVFKDIEGVDVCESLDCVCLKKPAKAIVTQLIDFLEDS